MKQEDSSKLVVTKHSRDSAFNVAVRNLDDEHTTDITIITFCDKFHQAPHLPERPTPRGKHFGSIREPNVFLRAELK
jgi:hypothetical protein